MKKVFLIFMILFISSCKEYSMLERYDALPRSTARRTLEKASYESLNRWYVTNWITSKRIDIAIRVVCYTENGDSLLVGKAHLSTYKRETFLFPDSSANYGIYYYFSDGTERWKIFRTFKSDRIDRTIDSVEQFTSSLQP